MVDPRGIIGNYVIEGELGRGGMGVVYAATHRVLGRPAAIKLLLANTIENRDRVERFFNEARAAMAIDHPGIVKVYDVGVDAEGRAYIAMERLDGSSLATRLQAGPLPLRVAVDFARRIADALAAAHAAGVIHRDLKPENIIISNAPPQRLTLVDFGIAKLANPVSVRTATGALLGTPLYMSPEQCEGLRELDARSDLYSLGCVLFAMLTGRPPFEGGGTGALIGAHLHVAPPALRARCPAASEALAAVVQCLLAKSRDDRFASARAVSVALANPEVSALAGASHVAPTADLAPAPSPYPPTAANLAPAPAPYSPPTADVALAVAPAANLAPAPAPYSPPLGPVPAYPPSAASTPSAAPPPAPHARSTDGSAFAPPGAPSGPGPSTNARDNPPPALAPSPSGRRGRTIAIVTACCAASAIVAILATRSCTPTTSSPVVALGPDGTVADAALVVSAPADAPRAADATGTFDPADLHVATRPRAGSGSTKQPRLENVPRASGSGSAARVARVEPVPQPRRTPEELPPDAGVATPPPPPPEVRERVLFDRGDFSVRAGQATLDKIAQLHRAHPSATILITAHVEDDEPGVLDTLGLARANAVKMQLVSRRVDRDRIRFAGRIFITPPSGDGSTRRADITFAP